MVTKIEDLLNDDFEYSLITLQYIFDRNKSQILINKMDQVTPSDLERYNQVKQKVKEGVPLQYAIGKWNFFGYDFVVTEDVLIPRPETEILVEQILKEDLDKKKVLDIGTGSGAISVSLSLNSNAEIFASDVSKNALKIAEENAKNLGAKVNFIHSDLFKNINEKFDIIVSNPPYLTEKEYLKVDKLLYFEPKLALVGGVKGYEIYERIIINAKDFLNKNGKLFFEIGFEQGEIVKKLLLRNGYKNIKIIKDYNNLDRIVIGDLCLNN